MATVASVLLTSVFISSGDHSLHSVLAGDMSQEGPYLTIAVDPFTFLAY